MIDFLKNKGLKAFYEISAIAEQPNLLFSNDKEQYHSEAQYNQYTIQKLNKLIHKHNISIKELQQIFGYIETSWSDYLSKYYRGKSFIFYVWADDQIPAFRVSVVSYYEGVELPFRCSLNKVNDMIEVLTPYVDKAQSDGVAAFELAEADEASPSSEADNVYKLIVYSKKIIG